MNIMNSKKAPIALFLAGIIFFSHSLPLYASNSYTQSEYSILKSDSTKVITDKSKAQNVENASKDVKSSKSTSSLAYNFIYYLISKFIQANPLYRPK